jgi:hypothetical protein
MAFTVPKTWSVGETLTAANFNTHIRDNQLSFGPHLIARKASDQNVTASTTLVNDDTLFTPSIAANEIWRLTLVHSVITGAGGMKSTWSIPTSSELQMLMTGEGVSALLQQARQTASDTPTLNYLANIASARLYVMEVLFINAGTAGAVTFRWAQTSASGTSTIKANSTLWGVKLA